MSEKSGTFSTFYFFIIKKEKNTAQTTEKMCHVYKAILTRQIAN